MPYMTFVLDDGTVVELETESSLGPGPGPTMRGGHVVAGAHRSFKEALAAVKETVATAVGELHDAFPDRPDELEIEFGIKASLEAGGLILARAAGEASFTVKALGKKRAPSRPGPPQSGRITVRPPRPGCPRRPLSFLRLCVRRLLFPEISV
jgi:hypothetical protein